MLSILLFSFLAVAKAPSVVEPNCFAKPCEIAGDFDGDGKKDSAKLVRANLGEKKKGIQIHLATGKTTLIGAGKAFGNGGDDFSWMNTWSLHKGKIEQGTEDGAPPKPKGQSLSVGKDGSASAVIYWDGKQFHWYQQGD